MRADEFIAISTERLRLRAWMSASTFVYAYKRARQLIHEDECAALTDAMTQINPAKPF